MAVIKSHAAGSMLKEAIVLDLGDLGRQAARMQAAAESKARQTLAAAELEAARLIEEGRASGLEEGRAAGLAEGRAAGLQAGRDAGYADALARASASFAEIDRGWRETGRQWEAQRETVGREAQVAVLEFALRLAEKLVHRIVEVDPTVVADQLAAALGHVLGASEATVRFCPEDRPALEAAMPELLAEFAHFKHIHLTEDAAIGRGGCVVTYGQGEVDATLETQLRRIVELMLPGEESPAPSPSGRGLG